MFDPSQLEKRSTATLMTASQNPLHPRELSYDAKCKNLISEAAIGPTNAAMSAGERQVADEIGPKRLFRPPDKLPRQVFPRVLKRNPSSNAGSNVSERDRTPQSNAAGPGRVLC